MLTYEDIMGRVARLQQNSPPSYNCTNILKTSQKCLGKRKNGTLFCFSQSFFEKEVNSDAHTILMCSNCNIHTLKDKLQVQVKSEYENISEYFEP